MSGKTEVYTWRVSAAVKTRLEEAAQIRRQSVAQLLDELVRTGLDSADKDGAADEKRQQRLHDRARRFLGCLSGDRSGSERVRELVRSRLKKQRDRARQ